MINIEENILLHR